MPSLINDNECIVFAIILVAAFAPKILEALLRVRVWGAESGRFSSASACSATCRDNLHIDVLIPSLSFLHPETLPLPALHGFTFSLLLASHSEKRPQQRARNAVEATTQTEEERVEEI